MQTVDIIDAFYIAASTTLLIWPLVHYGENNIILIYDARQAYNNYFLG